MWAIVTCMSAKSDHIAKVANHLGRQRILGTNVGCEIEVALPD